jgi:hypothetical protein
VLFHGEQPELLTLMVVCLQDGLALSFPVLNCTKISLTRDNMTTRSVHLQLNANQMNTGKYFPNNHSVKLISHLGKLYSWASWAVTHGPKMMADPNGVRCFPKN